MGYLYLTAETHFSASEPSRPQSGHMGGGKHIATSRVTAIVCDQPGIENQGRASQLGHWAFRAEPGAQDVPHKILDFLGLCKATGVYKEPQK